MEYFDFIQSNKRSTNVMTRCIIPENGERYKIDIGIYDLKRKEFSRGVLNRGKYVYTFIKIIITLFGEKDEMVYLMG